MPYFLAHRHDMIFLHPQERPHIVCEQRAALDRRDNVAPVLCQVYPCRNATDPALPMIGTVGYSPFGSRIVRSLCEPGT